MRKIPLSQGKFALVDDEDYPSLVDYKWFITGRGYAGRMTSRKSEKRTVVLMKDGKRTHLGYFSNVVDAARAYNSAAKTLFGEFAKLNPIK